MLLKTLITAPRNSKSSLQNGAINFLICGEFNQYEQAKCRKHGPQAAHPPRKPQVLSTWLPAVCRCLLNGY